MARADEKITVYELLRKAKNLSVTELAEKMGVSNATITQIEAGNRNPSDEMRENYSKALGVRPSTIMYFQEEKKGKNLDYQHSLLMILKKICEVE